MLYIFEKAPHIWSAAAQGILLVQGRQQLLILALVRVAFEANDQSRTATIWERYPVTGGHLIGSYSYYKRNCRTSVPGNTPHLTTIENKPRRLQLRMFIIYMINLLTTCRSWSVNREYQKIPRRIISPQGF